MVHWYSKGHNSGNSLFLLIIIWSVRLVRIRWSGCTSKFHRSLCILFSRKDFGLIIYYLFVWSNFNFLHNSQWINLPTQLCQVLYSFCTNFVSSPSPHNLHLPFYCIFSIIALIRLVLMALFCTDIWRDSVSLLRFPFISHVHVFSYEMSFVSRFKRP